MTKLVFCCSQLGLTKEVEYPDEQEITAEFVVEETLKRMKPLLGASKITAEASLYTESVIAKDHVTNGTNAFDLWSVDLKMGNGVKFMSMWVREVHAEVDGKTYA